MRSCFGAIKCAYTKSNLQLSCHTHSCYAQQATSHTASWATTLQMNRLMLHWSWPLIFLYKIQSCHDVTSINISFHATSCACVYASVVWFVAKACTNKTRILLTFLSWVNPREEGESYCTGISWIQENNNNHTVWTILTMNDAGPQVSS